MESYLMITQINDFIFCPRSIYFGEIYKNNVCKDYYQKTPQTVGTQAHRSVDEGSYSTSKYMITGLMVYSEKYNLLGRIDLLDTKRNVLTERKYSITKVYDGFRYQLYAQYFALIEMGYEVNALRLHSIKDNKNYVVDIPDDDDIHEFECVLRKINSFSLAKPFSQNPAKCNTCIYHHLCDYFEDNE